MNLEDKFETVVKKKKKQKKIEKDKKKAMQGFKRNFIGKLVKFGEIIILIKVD